MKAGSSEAGVERSMARFLPSRHKPAGEVECRGTNALVGRNLSPCRSFVKPTGAVSRYKLARRNKYVPLQRMNLEARRASGYNDLLDLSKKQYVAKTVTSLCTLLALLVKVPFLSPYQELP